MGSFKSFLKEKAENKGAFHRWLGKSEGDPITADDIAKGKAAGGHAAKMAIQAQNFHPHEFKEEVDLPKHHGESDEEHAARVKKTMEEKRRYDRAREQQAERDKKTNEEVEQLDEMMPIRDHEYHKKSDAELHYIMKDAHAAAKNIQGYDRAAHMKYLDQVNDAATVLNYRRKGGKRMAEETVLETKVSSKELLAKAEREAAKKAEASQSNAASKVSYIEALKTALRRIKGKKKLSRSELVDIGVREKVVTESEHEVVKHDNLKTWHTHANALGADVTLHGTPGVKKAVKNGHVYGVWHGNKGWMNHIGIKEEVVDAISVFTEEVIDEGKHPEGATLHRGVYYFKTHEHAVMHANTNGYPTHRIIEYGKGHAIQGGISGDYAGPHGLKIGDWKGVREEVIDELSKKTLGSYIKKAGDDRNYSGYKEGRAHARNDVSAIHEPVNRDTKRERGIHMAVKRLTKEEFMTESHEADELVLHADNDSHLHHSSHLPIIANLKRKAKNGVYDPEKAKKLWRYHADRAAKSYHKEYGDKSHPWHKLFTTAHRDEAAKHFEQRHRAEVHEKE